MTPSDTPRNVCGICGKPIRKFSERLWVHVNATVVPHAVVRSYSADWVAERDAHDFEALEPLAEPDAPVGTVCKVCGGVVRTAMGGRFAVHAWYLPEGVTDHRADPQ